MASDFQNASSDNDDQDLISNINVTPFVDVALVLLVIFMVTAPSMIKESLKVKLPKAQQSDAVGKNQSFGIVITENGQIFLEGALIAEEDLLSRIKNALESNPELQVLIAADENSKHKDLVRIMDLMKQAGVVHFAIQVRVNGKDK